MQVSPILLLLPVLASLVACTPNAPSAKATINTARADAASHTLTVQAQATETYTLLTPTNPCALLTKEEVSAALGRQVIRAHITPGSCIYMLGDTELMHIAIVKGNAQRKYAIDKKVSSNVQPVPGIGDKASWSSDALKLFAYKGEIHFFLYFGGMNTPTSLEVAKTLAQKLESRLPSVQQWVSLKDFPLNEPPE